MFLIICVCVCVCVYYSVHRGQQITSVLALSFEWVWGTELRLPGSLKQILNTFLFCLECKSLNPRPVPG